MNVVVKTRLGAKSETIEMVVGSRIMIMDRKQIQSVYIICKESVIGETIVRIRTTLYHPEKWNCASFTLWIVVLNVTNVCICITISLASSSILV